MKIISRRTDGTFVIEKNGYPYHVIDSDPLFYEAKKHGSTAPFESEPAVPPMSEQIRAQRNNLLAQSDWSQLPDAPVDQAAWATYRQSLRDITNQNGFPEVINWPTAPN